MFRLSALVFPGPSPKSHKVQMTSEIVVRANGVAVAKKVVGGKWTPEQVIKEFYRLPLTFTPLVKGINLRIYLP